MKFRWAACWHHALGEENSVFKCPLCSLEFEDTTAISCVHARFPTQMWASVMQFYGKQGMPASQAALAGRDGVSFTSSTTGQEEKEKQATLLAQGA